MAGILTFGSNRRLPRNAPSDIIWSVGNNADYSSGTVQDLHLIPFLICDKNQFAGTKVIKKYGIKLLVKKKSGNFALNFIIIILTICKKS